MSTLFTVQHKTLSWTGLAQILDNPLTIRERYLDKIRNNAIGVNIGDYFVISDDGGTLATGDASWFTSTFDVTGTVDQPPLTIQDSLSNPSRSQGSDFGPLHADRWCEVKYIIPLTITTALLGNAGGVGQADLKIGPSSATTLIDTRQKGVTMSVPTGQVNVDTLEVNGLVPPGCKVRLDLTQVSGSVSFGSITAVERVL